MITLIGTMTWHQNVAFHEYYLTPYFNQLIKGDKNNFSYKLFTKKITKKNIRKNLNVFHYRNENINAFSFIT